MAFDSKSLLDRQKFAADWRLRNTALDKFGLSTYCSFVHMSFIQFVL
jgi:hypothetical protein